MHSEKSRLKAGTIIFLLLPVLALSSCARVPWTTRIEGQQKSTVEQAFVDFTTSRSRCLSSWDGEVDINWSSAVRNYAFSAYCRVLGPSYLKLVVSNPLGQPLKAIATNGSTYQVIDTVERSMVTGSLRSWTVRHDLPLSLVSGHWLDWLEGRSSAAREQIHEVRLDNQQRGAWLSIIDTDTNKIEEYLLLDWESGRINERILIDEQQKTFANFEYLEWQEIDQCLYPAVLTIKGLHMGGQVELRFSEIRQNDFVPADFNLDVPRGFSKSWLP